MSANDPPADLAQLLKEWTKVSDATAVLTLRNNRAIKWLKVVVAATVLLLVAVITLFILYQDTVETVNASRCEAGNDYRRADKATWDFVFDLMPNENPDENTKAFRAFIDKKNKPLKC